MLKSSSLWKRLPRGELSREEGLIKGLYAFRGAGRRSERDELQQKRQERERRFPEGRAPVSDLRDEAVGVRD